MFKTIRQAKKEDRQNRIEQRSSRGEKNAFSFPRRKEQN
jgi:hypothetical protein